LILFEYLLHFFSNFLNFGFFSGKIDLFKPSYFTSTFVGNSDQVLLENNNLINGKSLNFLYPINDQVQNGISFFINGGNITAKLPQGKQIIYMFGQSSHVWPKFPFLAKVPISG